jgi:hypothetical protein
MTLRAHAPRARERWGVLLISVTLLLGMTATAVLAAPPKIVLDQCRNGAASTPNDCLQLGGSTGWVNGNVGAQQGHLLEGWSIPYRVRITDAATDVSTTIDIGYDIKHSGKHAIDFLTHYSRLDPAHNSFFDHDPENVDPTSGVNGIDPLTTTFTIPPPSSAGSPVSGQPTTRYNQLLAQNASQLGMTLFGGTITDIQYVSQGNLMAAQAETVIRVTFTLKSSTAVLAWGGHIARGLDWNGQSASAISGSPYHMRLKAWSQGNVGNQDRSLAAGAVQAEASTIITQPSDTTTFSATLNDTATVTGASPTGNVTFRLYNSLENCSLDANRTATVGTGGLLYAETKALPAGSDNTKSVSTSPGYSTSAAGTYYWWVGYAGDGVNEPSTSACGVEFTTITAPSVGHTPSAP